MQTQDLINSIPVLQEVMNMKINFNVGFKLQKITNEIDIVTKQYDEVRQDLLNKYGVISEDGQQYTFEDGQREKYDTKMAKLLAEEVDIEFKKISAELFKKVDIEPGKVRLIAWMLKD